MQIIDGQDTLCPYCGIEAKAKHIGNMRDDLASLGGALELYAWPVTVHKVGDKLALCCWRVTKYVDKWANTSFKSIPCEAVVLEGKKMIRLTGYHKMFNTVSWLNGWEQMVRHQDKLGECDVIYPFTQEILNGTEAENSKLDLYVNCGYEKLYPVQYLRLWQKRPNIENLLVQGAAKLVAEYIDKAVLYEPSRGGSVLKRMDIKHQDIQWKHVRPAQMLGLTKEEFLLFKERGWNLLELRLLTVLKKAGVKLCLPQDIETLREEGESNAVKLAVYGPAIAVKAARYLQKQRQKHQENARLCDAGHLTDYWDMRARLGDDLSDAAVRWPPNLVTAHNRAVDRQKYQEKKALRALFKKRYAELSRYAFEKDGILIRPAATEKELIHEGAVLHHCVAGYAENHAKGKTAIFLVRHAETPDIPFFTLELDEKALHVRQNRGVYNGARTPEVTAFEEAWLNWIKAGCPKERKKEEAVA
jgi:hypothetical protein